MDYEIKNQQGQTQGRLKLTTPIEVLFEGANTNIYKVIDLHHVHWISKLKRILHFYL
jgi:hypothetical protein